jgi:hypothetical protein
MYKLVDGEISDVNPEDYEVDPAMWKLYNIKALEMYRVNKSESIPLSIYKLIVSQELDRRCDDFIAGGFYSSCKDNTSKLYELNDRIRLLICGQDMVLGRGSQMPIMWKAVTDYIGSVWTLQEWTQFVLDAEMFEKTAVIATQTCKVYISMAESKEAIDVLVTGLTLNNVIS